MSPPPAFLVAVHAGAGYHSPAHEAEYSQGGPLNVDMNLAWVAICVIESCCPASAAMVEACRAAAAVLTAAGGGAAANAVEAAIKVLEV